MIAVESTKYLKKSLTPGVYQKVMWVKVLKNGPSKICGRHPLKNLTWPILEYFTPWVLEQICSWKLQVCVSMNDLLEDNRSYRINFGTGIQEFPKEIRKPQITKVFA